MSNGNGHSWSKLVWKDWKNEPTLRACSWAARGMWMDLLCLAHEGVPTGHITLNGRPPTLDELASMLGGKVREVEKLLAELETKGVFSRTTDGTIYSRRMVKDAALSVEGAKHAAKRNYHQDPSGGPNGSANGGGYGSPNGGANGNPNAKSTESERKKEEGRSPPYPPTMWGGGTPASLGTPPHRRKGTNFSRSSRDDDLDRMRRAVSKARAQRLGVDGEVLA